MSTIKKLNNFQNSFFDETLQKSDKDIFKSLTDEFTRQQNHIELNRIEENYNI